MVNVVLGLLFVAAAVAALIWRTVGDARAIDSESERAPVAPESPALAIRHGVGDLRGTGLRNDGSTAEREVGGNARKAE